MRRTGRITKAGSYCLLAAAVFLISGFSDLSDYIFAQKIAWTSFLKQPKNLQ
jgi:hypothetical protein